MKEYHKFIAGAIEASNLKKDPKLVYFTIKRTFISQPEGMASFCSLLGKYKTF